MIDDNREIRSRLGALERGIARRDRDAAGRVPAYLGRVYRVGVQTGFPAYYLTHPVTLSGPEAEGGTATLVEDTSVTVPVAVLDRSPATGDLLLANYFLPDGRWVARRGSGPGVNRNVYCSPCDIPKSDLVLSWYYWQVHYGGTYGTTYTAAGPIATPLAYGGGAGPNFDWTSGWFAGPSDSTACNPGVYSDQYQKYILGSDCCFIQITLSCNGQQGTNLSIGLSSDPMGRLAPDGKAYCYDGTVSARVGPATYSCSPFMITYQGTGFVGNLFAYGVVAP